MPPSRSDSLGEVGEDDFNDLSQQAGDKNSEQDCRSGSQDGGEGTNAGVPKIKRIACVLCRKRKLRCDGQKPSCGTCLRLAHDCSYDEVRRKSGPKRGYVKALEARLVQVETLLRAQDDTPQERATAAPDHAFAPSSAQILGNDDMVPGSIEIMTGQGSADNMPHTDSTPAIYSGPPQAPFPNTTLAGNAMDTILAGNDMDTGMSVDEPFPWEMIGLGLDEPLPNQDVVDELTKAYFDKVHPSSPMIHRPRFYAAMNLAPHMRPPVGLRYAMWCMAAGVLEKYESFQEHFYQRARKYIQQDEMKGLGEGMITTAHCQTWILLASYEFKLMYFPRAWMSSGRGSRLAQMMGLHRLDGSGLDVKQCLPPPKDWTEREERRRTFWMAFCVDRYASIGTGWPMAIEEQDILTTLPGEESDYEMSRPNKSMSLAEALEPHGAPALSGIAGVALMACLFGRNLMHLHRPGPDDRDDDLNGEFWARHRAMDNVLLNVALALPDQLRLPMGLNNPNIVFLNMNLHTSTICLHQAAIFKADKNRMPAKISAESKARCIMAAAEISSTMRMVSHLDLSLMNPFISFCLYVAARVFVQYLKSRPRDQQAKASLQFLLSAMHALKRKNPLTESFLVQLDVDLEGAGLEDSKTLRSRFMSAKNPPIRPDACPSQHLGFYPIRAQSSADGTKARGVTYGDMGLAAYNDPDSQRVPPVGQGMGAATFDLSVNTVTLEQQTRQQPTATALGHVYNSDKSFNIPSRQRTPGSTGGSNLYPSPQANIIDMDLSPDGSIRDHTTPGSSTQSQNNSSSHTSNTAYSPNPNHETQPLQDRTMPNSAIGMGGEFFAINEMSSGTPDFSMPDFDTLDRSAETDMVPPQNWSSGGTGMTPGANGGTGMTPGANGIDMMGLSDAEWTQMMEGMSGWDNALPEFFGGDLMGQSRR